MNLDLSHLVIAVIAFSIGRNLFKRRKTETYQNGPIQSDGQDLARLQRPDMNTDESGDNMPAAERIFTAIFLGGWLVAWTAGIFMAAGTFLDAEGGAGLFMVGWLIAAIAGWFMAVAALISILRGKRPKWFRRRW